MKISLNQKQKLIFLGLIGVLIFIVGFLLGKQVSNIPTNEYFAIEKAKTDSEISRFISKHFQRPESMIERAYLVPDGNSYVWEIHLLEHI
ncbi:MAG: hypothetical protein Q8M92_08345 [Candidatus Subteraquimicrobiales bacterium]|nr:hypothetical protein [Candidatus Subteraquimicrobiales bacterium]